MNICGLCDVIHAKDPFLAICETATADIGPSAFSELFQGNWRPSDGLDVVWRVIVLGIAVANEEPWKPSPHKAMQRRNRGGDNCQIAFHGRVDKTNIV